MDDESSNKKDSLTGAGQPEKEEWKKTVGMAYLTAAGLLRKKMRPEAAGLEWQLFR